MSEMEYISREEFSCVEAAIGLSMQRLGRKLTAEERETIVASYVDEKPQALWYDESGLVFWLSPDDPRLAAKLALGPVVPTPPLHDTPAELV